MAVALWNNAAFHSDFGGARYLLACDLIEAGTIAESRVYIWSFPALR